MEHTTEAQVPGAATPDRVDQAGKAKRVRTGAGLLVAAVLLWVVAVVVLATAAFGLKFSLASAQPYYRRNQAGHCEVALALVLVTGPTQAAALSHATRRGKAKVVLLLLLSATMVVPALYIGRVGREDGRVGHLTPPPVVTQCIPRSGSLESCPGG